ncbi:Stp1/IreP family PP2C-type Ser/Thr phosphatase [Pajaroellobacter abortibovis]|nr:Stp1/IreP family PP2C-type Ser/Thr phosphatase [Pajaroellobacter abortibovis]
MRAIAAGVSDVGLQRHHNEDSFLIMREHDIFIVADGMGGHRAGDVASQLAIEAITTFFQSTAHGHITGPFYFDTQLSEKENRFLASIHFANKKIFEKSNRVHQCYGMGTTIVGAMFNSIQNRMLIGHVGDSRCYRIRKSTIQLLTNDHSLYNEYLVDMPNLTEQQLQELPRNVITRALGMQEQVVVDFNYDNTHAGDIYLLCSDGLSSMLSEQEIHQIVVHSQTIQNTCQQLVQRANERGGTDNITVIVIHIE